MTDTSSPLTVSQPPASVSRRKFISGLSGVILTAATGLLVAPAIRNLVAESADSSGGWLTLCPLASLAPGVPSGFPFTRQRRAAWSEVHETGVAYAVTHDGRAVQVYSNVCTHGGCRVAWQSQQGQYVCPCHLGAYAADGRVQAGLPPAPLEQFPTRVMHGLVQILFVV